MTDGAAAAEELLRTIRICHTMGVALPQDPISLPPSTTHVSSSQALLHMEVSTSTTSWHQQECMCCSNCLTLVYYAWAKLCYLASERRAAMSIIGQETMACCNQCVLLQIDARTRKAKTSCSLDFVFAISLVVCQAVLNQPAKVICKAVLSKPSTVNEVGYSRASCVKCFWAPAIANRCQAAVESCMATVLHSYYACQAVMCMRS